MEPLEFFIYTTNMWAVIAQDGKTVVDVIRPDIEYEAALKEISSYKMTLVEITIENTPCYVMGEYRNGKFYPPIEIQHLYKEGEKNWLSLQ